MNIAEYAEMYNLETFYWWFVARRDLLEWFVKEIVKEFDHPAMRAAIEEWLHTLWRSPKNPDGLAP